VLRRVLPVALLLAAALADARSVDALVGVPLVAAVPAGAAAVLLLVGDLVDGRGVRAEVVVAATGLAFTVLACALRSHDLGAAALTSLAAAVACYTAQAVVAAVAHPGAEPAPANA
jgi:hypothetical protein